MSRHIHKKNLFTLGLILTGLVLLVACGDDENAAEPPNYSGDACMIDVLELEWVKECGDDTYFDERKIQLHYDSNKNLIEWKWFVDHINDFGNESALFYYNIESKIEQIIWKKESGTYTIDFSWEGNTLQRKTTFEGLIKYKEIIELNSANLIQRIDGFNIINEEEVHTWYSNYVWQNGNLTEINEYRLANDGKMPHGRLAYVNFHLFDPLSRKKTILAKNHTDKNNFVLCYRLRFNYDNEFNPFKLQPALSFWNLWSPLFHSENNIISLKEESFCFAENQQWEQVYKWGYDENACPEELFMLIDYNDNCTWEESIKFFYPTDK
jgi:hypothetical protein